MIETGDPSGSADPVSVSLDVVASWSPPRDGSLEHADRTIAPTTQNQKT